ncbi:alpha/beta hydrolase [Mesotoga sp. Brook.08.105.5.1]|uniref:alpha/beta hydrolase family protein n=1 Tax=Mesotoga sp. Brook.08.105.5.1 TaxID=1421002 RepID=UPI000C19B9A9|nr:alpha/beta fold hydrolase [Mesotoga sp. Brook.08.105.5.1]PVD16576.1 alpha/beta hydrolase [Mesotoga sp. Brook.08.105.5.1]
MKKHILSTVLLMVVLFFLTVSSHAITTHSRSEISKTAVHFFNEGQRINGILTEPELLQTPAPVIILLHGFLGHMDDLLVNDSEESLFEMTARIFAERGISSLRFDFRGSGISEGEWKDTTFNKQVSDAISSISFLQSLENADSNRIGVVGLSQGGLVAACLAARDSRVRSVALWSAVAIPIHTYSALLGVDSVERATNATPFEEIVASISWGGITVLRKEFFDELFSVNPVAEIVSYTGPLLVVSGLKDDLVFPQPEVSRLFITYHKGVNRLLEQDSGHIFDLFDRQDKVREIIEATLEWFIITL